MNRYWKLVTDKVDTEVPSTHAGVLKEVLAKVGDVIKVGAPIAIITTDGESKQPTAAPAVHKITEEKVLVEEAASVAHVNGSSPVADYQSSSRFYSPLVKNIAKEEKITVAELETITGTGVEGGVTKKDILSYVQNRKLGATIQTVQHSVSVSCCSERSSCIHQCRR